MENQWTPQRGSDSQIGPLRTKTVAPKRGQSPFPAEGRGCQGSDTSRRVTAGSPSLEEAWVTVGVGGDRAAPDRAGAQPHIRVGLPKRVSLG